MNNRGRGVILASAIEPSARQRDAEMNEARRRDSLRKRVHRGTSRFAVLIKPAPRLRTSDSMNNVKRPAPGFLILYSLFHG